MSKVAEGSEKVTKNDRKRSNSFADLFCGTRILGKRKHTPPCFSAELFFAEKNGGHRGKISVVDMVFLVFIGFLYRPPAWKVFLWGQKSSPQDLLSVVVVYAFFFSAIWGWLCDLRKHRQIKMFVWFPRIYLRYRYRLDIFCESEFVLCWCSSACGALVTTFHTDTEFDGNENSVTRIQIRILNLC